MSGQVYTSYQPTSYSPMTLLRIRLTEKVIVDCCDQWLDDSVPEDRQAKVILRTIAGSLAGEIVTVLEGTDHD